MALSVRKVGRVRLGRIWFIEGVLVMKEMVLILDKAGIET